MKRLFTLFILLLTVFAVHAQNLSVESFRMDIKDLTAKVDGKNYIRLAVRSSEENDALILALRQESAKMINKRP